MKPELPKLNYSYDSLEPSIDAKTMEIHYTKHHQAYIDKLNLALEKHPELQDKPIEELLGDIESIPEDIRNIVINHGGGHANHSFFWEILSPENQEDFEGEVSKGLKESFADLKDFNEFKVKFKESAMARFGSGWVWVVLNKDKKLEIITTANQDSPLMDGLFPVIGLDLWEHAYYLKYQNKRADYVESFWKILNWKKVDEIYQKAMSD
ncbi:superoxide dismutase [Candidatus Pacearchaeota archaeon CG10_big_fil_rev_8_21_14_0_10_31_24]|nr:MAG: superoxide dismutase [Candidatus Pacearchaeota archaeon CG10_big_fil_rev_8_21_14_0_10_31_24]